jgi:hypothetical protein
MKKVPGRTLAIAALVAGVGLSAGALPVTAMALNPQPLPPRHAPVSQAFNPQPDPPGRAGVILAFNPQPDPPGRA